MIRNSWRSPLLVVEWYLVGLVAWTVWANPKMAYIFWELGKLSCRSCQGNLAFLSASFLFGLASWLLAPSEGKRIQLRLTNWTVFSLLIALFLPSFLSFPKPWQILTFSLVLSFKLSTVIRQWPRRQLGLTSQLCLALFVASLYSLLTLSQWYSLSYPARDVGVFHQAIWHLSRGQWPGSSIKGLDNLWGDHFHPSIVLFVPFYWLAKFPGVLLAQTVLVAIGTIGVVKLAMQLTGSSWTALVYALSYALFFGFQESVAFGFYPEIIIPGALVFAFYGLVKKNHYLYWLSLLVALLTKENVGLYLVFIGIVVCYLKKYRRAIITAGLGLGWFFLSTRWLIPSFGRGEYLYTPAIKWVNLLNPLFVFRQLIFPPIKIETLSLTLVSFGALPIFSLPWSIPLIPMFLERFVPQVLNRWTTGFHYSLPLAPVLVMASLKASLLLQKRYQPKTKLNLQVFLPLLALISSLSITVLDHRPLVNLAKTREAISRETQLLINYHHQIPQDSSLASSNGLVAYLAGREKIYSLPTRSQSKYLSFDKRLNLWPLTPKTLDQLRVEYRQSGYLSVFQSKDNELLHHPRLN